MRGLLLVPLAVALDCTNGVTCRSMKASGLRFDCHFAGNGTRGDVVMLHGFPEWSEMYTPLMRKLAHQGYRSLACDQRGYSEEASPESVKEYSYNKLRDDVFNTATAAGFGNFHLVAHDHGAALGWYALASASKERILSFCSLSVPHIDVMSAALFGDGADLHQQIASQYYTVFTLKDSASLHHDAMFNTMGRLSGFQSAADFQKAVWWYNGADEVGVVSMPPVLSASYLALHGNLAMAAMRKLYGEVPDAGYAQRTSIGAVTVPVTFLCGADDTSVLCWRPYAALTKNYVKADYKYIKYPLCGHMLLSMCLESQAVEDAIIDRITSNSVVLV